MNIRELLNALEELRTLYGDTAAKAAEKNVAKVIELLTPHDDKSLEAFIEEVRAAAASAEGRTAAPPAAVDEAAVERYVHRLTEAGTDTVAFDQAFAELSGDAGIKQKEVDAIARQFTHRTSPFKTKKAALTAIRQTFVERVRFENKLRAVS
jgi:soluble lytic murein transglycosylase-like protein